MRGFGAGGEADAEGLGRVEVLSLDGLAGVEERAKGVEAEEKRSGGRWHCVGSSVFQCL